MPECDGCGAKVIWIKNENGKRTPLDARNHPIYVLNDDPAGSTWVRVPGARITHFATCRKAAEFSGKNKKA